MADVEAVPEVDLDGTLDQVLGFEFIDTGEEGVVRGSVPVRDRVKQPFGLVHGGVYAALAESLASAGTFRVVAGEGNVAMGSSNHTSFLRPVTEGTIHAQATARHRGRTSWVWQVDFTDDGGRLCALSHVTIAVRPRPG